MKKATLEFESISEMEEHLEVYHKGLCLSELDEKLRNILKYDDAEGFTKELLLGEWSEDLPTIQFEVARAIVYATLSKVRNILLSVDTM